jgi:predicted MFS family arabinose efflux permease
LSTGLVAKSQQRFGRKVSFLLGLVVALISAGIGAWAVLHSSFLLLVVATMVAGYYSANGQLYRFAAAELCTPDYQEKAVSLVMAGGLMGAIIGPNLAMHTKNWLELPFAGAYVALAGIALLSMALMSFIEFPPVAPKKASDLTGRPLNEIMRHPVFFVATLSAALGYGVMNLLMAATPLAMQVCGLSFEDTAWVLQWHVIGMFAPGFVTGHLIKRFGVLTIMGFGAVLNIACISIALSGVDIHQFLLASFLLGVGWNFLFTGSTTLSMQAYTPPEKDKAQAAINFCVFATMACTSFASGALVTTQGWTWLNWGSLLPVVITVSGLLFLRLRFKNV